MKKQTKTLLTALIATAALTATLTTPASAKNYFVGIATPWDTADGGHYKDATAANLIAAVKAANENDNTDVIYVGIGRYYLTEELILSDVLEGGYQNSGQTRYYPASEGAGNGSDLDKMTILDGNSLRTTVDNTLKNIKHRVATVKTGGVIDGCLIRNGHARSTTSNPNEVKHGGGVLLKGGSIYNCILRGNVAFNPGGSSFSYDGDAPTNSKWSINAPAKGGAVYIDKEGGNVVNCLIYSNMDDLGLGIDCAESGSLTGDANIINNTVVNNANCPRMAYLVNTKGFKIINDYNDMNESGNKDYTLSPYYLSSTETTNGQFACFLNAIEPTISGSNVVVGSNVVIGSADLSAILSAYAPLSGHRNKTVKTVLDIGTAVSTTAEDWILCLFGTTATNPHGQMYYNSTSKIFGSRDADVVELGESPHNNNYACGDMTWYGGMAYSIWLGGMLPTLGQWYYGGCATNNSGGKATPTSHYPSPTEKTITPNTGDDEDVVLNKIAWQLNDRSKMNRRVHEVGKKAPNSVGVYDVSGNLDEWCLDWYMAKGIAYSGGQDGVSVVYNASNRVHRGGAWGSHPYSCSLGYRGGGSPPHISNSGAGFRAAVAP
jgi:formylglycine-generating enzyme required for sulfatase activity